MTIIETLLVLSIFGFLVSGASITFNNLQHGIALRDVRAEVVQVLELAHNRAATGFGTTSQGVHFEDDKLVLFSGEIYTPGEGEDIIFSPFVSVHSEDTDVIFSRIRAIPGSDNTVTISNSSGESTVSVSPEGIISVGE